MALALMLLGGAALALALLLGAANPPYAAHMTRFTSSNFYKNAGGLTAISSLKMDRLPLTFQLEARVSGTPDAEWGFWIWAGNELADFHIRSDGYFHAPGSNTQQFPFIRPDMNTLYLSITSDDPQADFPSDYHYTFRINDEIAEQGTMATGLSEWGVFPPQSGNIDWKSIKVYTG
ncbi:MAG TPA: hypothetical protein VHD90_11395 [Phototrophicaceae bacterium]|nr:hypothetical protein [Phototrophicaceae bacterium]